MTEQTQGRTRPSASELQPALARMLRPLVRLMIRSGITFPALSELLREVYVNVADREFALQGKAQTDSRVSILTGVHRKEVRRLREAGAPVSTVPTTVSRSSLILAHWLGSPDFLDTSGHPLALPRIGGSADTPSFEDLVMAVTRDIRPRAVLDEWLAQGIVSVDPDNWVRLETAALVPSQDMEALAYYFGRNLHDHMAAGVENLAGHGPVFLDRAVHYDHLSEEVARDLEAKSRVLALAALQAANKDALAATAHETPQTEPGKGWRWSFGLYIFRERSTQAP